MLGPLRVQALLYPPPMMEAVEENMKTTRKISTILASLLTLSLITPLTAGAEETTTQASTVTLHYAFPRVGVHQNPPQSKTPIRALKPLPRQQEQPLTFLAIKEPYAPSDMSDTTSLPGPLTPTVVATPTPSTTTTVE